jgi:hypothetical protein
MNIMGKVFLSEAQQTLNNTRHLYERQANKKFNYSFDEFIIDKHFNFRHKTWRTYVKGGSNLQETTYMINRYIAECNKPYGERNLDFIHLLN